MNQQLALWEASLFSRLQCWPWTWASFSAGRTSSGMKEALAWFGSFNRLALLFNIGIILFHDTRRRGGLEFFTGFLVEKSLSASTTSSSSS